MEKSVLVNLSSAVRGRQGAQGEVPDAYEVALPAPSVSAFVEHLDGATKLVRRRSARFELPLPSPPPPRPRPAPP